MANIIVARTDMNTIGGVLTVGAMVVVQESNVIVGTLQASAVLQPADLATKQTVVAALRPAFRVWAEQILGRALVGGDTIIDWGF